MFPSYRDAHNYCWNRLQMDKQELMPGTRWQGRDVSGRPDFATREALGITFALWIGTWDRVQLQQEMLPDLPWAEDHFQERVAGVPSNPGKQYKNWPHFHNDLGATEDFVAHDGKFSHTYQERIWTQRLTGIRFDYGNLTDVIDLLKNDPFTRRAWLPIFFPEDTGRIEERIPCTLGYQFMRRDNHLHGWYVIRSCDYHRHLTNDVYMAARLLQWVGTQIDIDNDDYLMPGFLTTHIFSLHLHAGDAHNYGRGV